MKRRSFFLGLSALFAGGVLPRIAEAAFGLRRVSGIRPLCTCKIGTVRRVVVCNDPDLWFEIQGDHDPKCLVKQMVRQWAERGYYLIPAAPGDNTLRVGDHIVRIRT